MKDNPSYYSILPASVRYSKDLTDFQKILFSEITALANKDGYCSASNGYFAELYGKEPENISRHISKLESAGFLRRFVVKNEAGQIIHRHLFPSDQVGIVEKYKGGTVKNVNTPTVNSDKGGTVKNVKENNTSINTTRENKETHSPAPLPEYHSTAVHQRDVNAVKQNPNAWRAAVGTFKTLAGMRGIQYELTYLDAYFSNEQKHGRYYDLAAPANEADTHIWLSKHSAGLQLWAMRQGQFDRKPAPGQTPDQPAKAGFSLPK